MNLDIFKGIFFLKKVTKLKKVTTTMLNYLKEINKKAKCLDLESHIRTNSTF